MAREIKNYEIISHGIKHEDYFQGCGTSFTEFDFCYTGIGNNYKEALDSAIEDAAQSDWNTEKIEKELNNTPESLDVIEEYGENVEGMYYYVSIRLR